MRKPVIGVIVLLVWALVWVFWIRPDGGAGEMRIRAVRTKEEGLFIETDGATIWGDRNSGVISVAQKIGVKRDLFDLRLKKEFTQSLKLISKNSEKSMWVNDGGGRVTISGDSVIDVEGVDEMTVALKFLPEYKKFEGKTKSLLALDKDGGLVVAVVGGESKDVQTSSGESLETWHFNKKVRVLIGASPPKEFNWSKSFNQVIHYCSYIKRYPTDEDIVLYSGYGNVLQLHSWIWQERYEPYADALGREMLVPKIWEDRSWLPQDYRWIPEDEAELRRVINKAHAQKMKVVVYVGMLEGEVSGGIRGIREIKDKYGIDGVYIDGLFPGKFDEAYEAIREVRGMFGQEGWIALHDTNTGFYLPFVHAYADLVVSGEHQDFDRWKTTTYNISNSIGSYWPEIERGVDDARDYLKKLTDESLQYNNRLVFLVGESSYWDDWRINFSPAEFDFVNKYYGENLEKLKSRGR